MKLSDYVIDYLHAQGTSHVFGMSGGAAVHLFDSASRHDAVTPVFMAHEQSAAMAADGYYRASGRIGACVVTSGPGATNLLTGVCCSYYDSVPALMLTGQVATGRLKGSRKVRQVGFQETETTAIYASVTKSAVQIAKAADIVPALESAYRIAQDQRPGPVLIDVPDDLQRADLQVQRPVGASVIDRSIDRDLPQQVAALLNKITLAKRPVLVVGGGFSTPRKSEELREFLSRVAVPVVQTWAGLDLLPSDWPHRIGTFGVYGSRLGNFTVQNADLLVCLGTRLSQNLTGGALKDFAPGAEIVMVDIDRGEMDKFDGYGIEVSGRIEASMADFLASATAALETFVMPDIDGWLAQIDYWQSEMPDDVPAEPADSDGFVDAHRFVRKLSGVLAEDELIFVDTGGNLTWTCNNLLVKARQRVLSAWNFTPMGYALPASIGGAFAAPGSSITCIIGDGGLQLCLGELATVVRHALPIKIILFNNHSHGIQKQTLETWLEGHYAGVDPASGLGLSHYPDVAKAMGLPVVTIDASSDIGERLEAVYRMPGPVFCNVEIRVDQKLHPVLKSGAPLDDQMPLMPREKLAALRLLKY